QVGRYRGKIAQGPVRQRLVALEQDAAKLARQPDLAHIEQLPELITNRRQLLLNIGGRQPREIIAGFIEREVGPAGEAMVMPSPKQLIERQEGPSRENSIFTLTIRRALQSGHGGHRFQLL